MFFTTFTCHFWTKALFFTEWLERRAIKRLVLVISSIATREVLERWQFRIDNEESGDADEKENTAPTGKGAKDEKKIRAEISDVMRQITASVTFLPLLEEPCKLCFYSLMMSAFALAVAH